MSYNKMKMDAFAMIDKMLSKGENMALIEFKVATQYGFSKKIIQDRIDMIEKLRKAGENEIKAN